MYQDQLARAKRFLHRIEQRRNDQVEYEDMLWAFFQNCWHVKDWIKNDNSAPQALRDAIWNHEPENIGDLQLCAELANGSKHLKLIQNPHRPHRDAKIRNDVNVFIGESMTEGGKTQVRTEYSYFVTDNTGTECPAHDVARNAVAAWEALIVKHGGTV
jgi:hypothetical protein